METNNQEKVKTTVLTEALKNMFSLKNILAITLGGLGGFLYYYFIGCTSGSCAITSDPYSSIFFGIFMGVFITNSPCARGRC